MMKIEQLDMFSRVVVNGSISATAREVHRVPSNITTRIRQLEEELGVELFIREKQSLRPTPAGYKLKEYSDRILFLMQEAKQVVSGQELRGIVTIGSIDSTATIRLPPIMAKYHKEYPRIILDLSTGPSGTVLDGVIAGKLAAGFLDGPIRHPDIESLPVFREEMVIISSRDMTDISSPQTINGINIYAFRENCSYRRHFEEWFHAQNAAPDTIYELESYHGMIACVISGGGIAMLPRSMLESLPAREEVTVHQVSEAWRYLDTYLIWRKGTRTAILDALIETLPISNTI